MIHNVKQDTTTNINNTGSTIDKEVKNNKSYKALNQGKLDTIIMFQRAKHKLYRSRTNTGVQIHFCYTIKM